MRPFRCAVCTQLLFFDNSSCLSCGSPLGFIVDENRLVALVDGADPLVAVDGTPGRFRRCANLATARCNWLVPVDDSEMLCASCRLTTVRPNDAEVDAVEAFANAEAAKRRLLSQLKRLGLPVVARSIDSAVGVAFEFLSSRGQDVITGHEAGVITLDLSESDDAHREFVRQQLGEAYRTVLGHLRHEIGHYYWPMLVSRTGRLEEFRSLFGDERESYDDALGRHYQDTAIDGWSTHHVSQYAAMHPWEDWAETFAHYLHIDDGLETAAEFGLQVGEPSLSAGAIAAVSFSGVTVEPMVQKWLSLTIGLNGMSRSIGQGDLYPFVLNPMVIAKLDFVHRAITG